jgi:hypothetical protein
MDDFAIRRGIVYWNTMIDSQDIGGLPLRVILELDDRKRLGRRALSGCQATA